MTTQLLVAQENSMQQYISKDKAALVANLSPYKTYKKLDTATTNKFEVSKMVAPMLLGIAGGEISEDKIKKIQESLAKPEKIGLEIEKEVYLWMQKPDNPSDEIYLGESNPLFFNVIIPITDGKKFRKFLDELFGVEKTKQMIPTGDAMNMIHDKMLINWNKNRLIISGSTVGESFFEEPEQFQERNKKMLLQHATALGKVTTANSIAQDGDYQKHLQKDADFDFWMDYNNFMPPVDQVPAQARELAESMIKFLGDIKLGGNAFMKKAEAQLLIEMYMNDAMARVMESTYKYKLNKNFFKYIDNTNLMGMYSMAISPEGFFRSYGVEAYKVLKQTKEGTLITNALDILDIFVGEEEIFTLLKGDMLIAVTDIKIVERETKDFEYNEETDKWEEVNSTSKEPMPIAVMMMSYGSEENIMKFVDLGANAGVLSKKSDGVWAIGGAKEELGVDIFIIVHDGILMVTNDATMPENLKSGIAKDKQLDSKDVKDITSYVQYGFADVSKMIPKAKEIIKTMGGLSESEEKIMSRVEKTIKRVELKTFTAKGNEITSEFNLKMVDPEGNVLQTLVDGLMKMNEMQNSSSEEESPEEKRKEQIKENDGTKKL
jgi:hypothetical protein